MNYADPHRRILSDAMELLSYLSFEQMGHELLGFEI